MSEIAISLPVSVEQIAAAVVNMSSAEQDRLLSLVPSLRERASQHSVLAEEAGAIVNKVQQLVAASPGYQPLTGNEPFMDDITLNQYLALPDDEQAKLWNQWEGTSLYDMEEIDLEGVNTTGSEGNSNAVSAR